MTFGGEKDRFYSVKSFFPSVGNEYKASTELLDRIRLKLMI